MLSIGPVGGAGAAAAYFNKDDYYARDDASPSEWLGAGSAALGLEGPVQKDDLQAVLDGQVIGTDQLLGRIVDGERTRRSGFDLTFSAPKSVSIMAEVAGDDRLVKAHDDAVRAAVARIESDLAATRITRPTGVEQEKTGSLVVAAFRHDLSRNQDPQLHTHAVVANMTQSSRGWRSLDAKALFDQKMALGRFYRQELALRVRALGYDIDVRRDGTFEIRGVDAQTVEAFSTRRAEIVASLKASGIALSALDPVAAARAAIATRQRKQPITRDEARATWMAALGADSERALNDLKAQAEANAQKGALNTRPADRERAADDILQTATATLSEREAAFSTEKLLELANRMALGRASEADILAAKDRAVERGDLVGKAVVEADRRAQVDLEKDGMATARMRAVETEMIAGEARGRGAARRIASPRLATAAIARAEDSAIRAGHSWTDDQRRATAGLLLSTNMVHGVQGYAGSAKTTTVIATYATEARRAAFDVRALAPTASAAETLGRALGLRPKTVDQHLIDVANGRNPAVQSGGARAEQVWIVDEASLLSSEKLRNLIVAAETEKARIVLVGDVRQLGSVEAGAGFRQLQAAGMQTERLETIVRQRDSELRGAVERAAAGDAQGALSYFIGRPDRLVENRDVTERQQAVAAAYLALSPRERAETIVVEPSREGRDAVTDAIRAGLVREGALGADKLDAARFASKGVTAAERRLAMSYDPGDRIRFDRDYTIGSERVAKDSYVTVRAVSQHAGTVTLRTASGVDVDWRPAQKGAQRAEVYEERRTDLRVGDRIVWARNDKDLGLRNGQSGVVEGIDPKARTVTVAFEGAGPVTLSTREDSHRHWRHDYAQTAYAAQGKTSERVIVHAESSRINLVNQPSTYVAISRAKESGLLVTDDIGRLHHAIAGRAGQKETALDAAQTQAAAEGVARTRAARATPMEVLREKAREIMTSSRFSQDPRARAAVAEAARDSAGVRPQVATVQRSDAGLDPRAGPAIEERAAASGRGPEAARATERRPDREPTHAAERERGVDAGHERSGQAAKEQRLEQDNIRTLSRAPTRDHGGFER
jgi:conjugative relaxase-like TrwC/TraI family protein